MKRPLAVTAPVLAALAVLAHAPAAAARATFDDASASLKLPSDAAKAYGFETAESLVGAELVTWAPASGFYPSLVRKPIATADDVASRLTSAEDAVEGAHGLRLGVDGTGFAITDPDLLGSLAAGRFEVTLWARADGATPQLHVVYDRDPANVYAGKSEFATVRGMRTGRETTDGWAEYAATPLDGNVWGVPVRAIMVLPSSGADPGTSFLVDALEVRAVSGRPVEPRACTQATVDAVCGAEGDCMFGHCVASTVTWGVLPAESHRAEIAERWITYATRLIGDRNAAARGVSIFLPDARRFAQTAPSSRQFFGGLNALVNALHDNHTSFGSPSNFTSFAPQVVYASSSILGACFGVVEKDIAGGGLGYAVFKSIDAPLSGVPLKRGDVVFAIDGEDPKAWVDENWLRFATASPSDMDSAWGASANDLARLVATRASKISILRCASPTQCDASSRQIFDVDVAKAGFTALTSPPATFPPSFGCSQRFTESVETSGNAPYTGEDPVDVAVGPIGETRVQFDGFVGQTKWKASMTSIFTPKPHAVLMDARMGHGGYYDAVQALFDLVRGTSEPTGVISIGRGTYDLTDPPWLFDRLANCASERPDQWSCFEGSANGFFTRTGDPPGGATRIAWLNTFDVSANDFMPRLLKGRTNLKIFGPHPTSGAFGAITDLPSLITAWSGGSMQVQDARFAADQIAAASVRWESGHGVEPDVVVAEKLSDALVGVDTILQQATAWLANP